MTLESSVACLAVTTSGRTLLQWEQDAPRRFRTPQLSLLLASLFHFSRAQPAAQLELHSGLSLAVAADARAQLCVAVVCVTGDALALALAKLQSRLVLHELLRGHGEDLARLAAESSSRAELLAETYTLSSALDGLQEAEDGTLDELVAFQSGFVARLMDCTTRSALRTWSLGSHAASTAGFSAVRLLQGLLVDAETGHVVYATPAAQDAATAGVRRLLDSSRAQQLVARVACALQEGADVLRGVESDEVDAEGHTEATVVLGIRSTSERPSTAERGVFVALRLLSVGTFAGGVVFDDSNDGFWALESGRCRSDQVQHSLAADTRGAAMLRLLRDPSSDFELRFRPEDAPEAARTALDTLERLLVPSWPASRAAVGAPGPKKKVGSAGTSAKGSASPRSAQQTQ